MYTPTEQYMQKAIAYATMAHDGQFRRNGIDPYINHCLRVGRAAFNWSIGCGISVEGIAAGYLHDVVEDTSITLSVLRENFHPRTVALVHLLTFFHGKDGVKDLDRYYAAIASDAEALVLKILDRTDNLVEARAVTSHVDKVWAKRYVSRTHQWVRPLVEQYEQERGSVHLIARFHTALRNLEQHVEGVH